METTTPSEKVSFNVPSRSPGGEWYPRIDITKELEAVRKQRRSLQCQLLQSQQERARFSTRPPRVPPAVPTSYLPTREEPLLGWSAGDTPEANEPFSELLPTMRCSALEDPILPSESPHRGRSPLTPTTDTFAIIDLAHQSFDEAIEVGEGPMQPTPTNSFGRLGPTAPQCTQHTDNPQACPAEDAVETERGGVMRYVSPSSTKLQAGGVGRPRAFSPPVAVAVAAGTAADDKTATIKAIRAALKVFEVEEGAATKEPTVKSPVFKNAPPSVVTVLPRSLPFDESIEAGDGSELTTPVGMAVVSPPVRTADIPRLPPSELDKNDPTTDDPVEVYTSPSRSALQCGGVGRPRVVQEPFVIVGNEPFDEALQVVSMHHTPSPVEPSTTPPTTAFPPWPSLSLDRLPTAPRHTQRTYTVTPPPQEGKAEPPMSPNRSALQHGGVGRLRVVPPT